nr:hypothetical protein [uncultured Butyrivibrio sp.]
MSRKRRRTRRTNSSKTAKIVAPVQDQYKDRLFKFLFGNEERKQNALDLYNAINGTDYKDVDDLKFNTIDDVIYMGMQNDVSFIFQDCLNMYEQQSSYNPNMPLRGLVYTGLAYHRYVKVNKVNWYSSNLKKIPVPVFIVFYNGTKEEPDVETLKLSDAFIGNNQSKEKACVEFVAKMYNINNGHNKGLLDACQALKEYAALVEIVREKLQTMDIDTAMDEAVKECINKNILRDVLVKFRSEVIEMLLTEYNEVETMNAIREETDAERLVKDVEGIIEEFDAPVERACKACHVSVEEYYAAKTLLNT